MKAPSLFSLLVLCGITTVSAQDSPADSFAARCLEIGQEARTERISSVRGHDPRWFFLTTELLHLGAGPFWEKDWATTAVNGQDPVPFMVQFNDLLKEKDIQLLVVPVPAKAAIYPDHLSDDFEPGAPAPTAPFYEQLRQAGLNVLDLEPFFREQREAGIKMHCEQDAHFTPRACQLIAQQIVQSVSDEAWVKNLARQPFVRTTEQELTIVGDQVPEDLQNEVAETLTVQYAGLEQNGGISPVDPDPSSPVLLLGDSHTLVFQEGPSRGMHCKGAGLLDQLQAEFGMPLDLVGVRGSGLKTARVQLYRHAATQPGYWDNKKLVVWCFSVREFTQGFDKLVEIPIER